MDAAFIFYKDEDHRLSEQQFVNCSKQSSGCTDALMNAAFTFYKMTIISPLSSSSLIAPSRAVATMMVFEELMFVNRAALAVALETLIAL